MGGATESASAGEMHEVPFERHQPRAAIDEHHLPGRGFGVRKEQYRVGDLVDTRQPLERIIVASRST